MKFEIGENYWPLSSLIHVLHEKFQKIGQGWPETKIISYPENSKNRTPGQIRLRIEPFSLSSAQRNFLPPDPTPPSGNCASDKRNKDLVGYFIRSAQLEGVCALRPRVKKAQ